MSDHEHLLKTEELTKLFGGLRAIDRISLTLREGEAVGVIGPNGSGKSTLVNVVMGVYAPDGGRVVYAGEDITGLPPEAIARRGIGCAFQIAGPFAEMTVLENMLVAGLAQPKNSRRERALELLDLVSLADLRQHKAGNISFGQTKLLELARLLMLDPRLILLDEPAAGLHPVMVERMEEVIRRLQPAKTFLIIEHDVTLISRLCGRVLVLSDGRLLAQGSLDEILNDPQVQEVYFGA